MPFVKSDGIDLYYEVHGDGPAVVLAHGRGGSHLSWWQQVPTLSKHCKVVTFDHRGFGLSNDVPKGPGRAAYASDLRNLLDHLGIEKAYLVGQSMGGWTALAFAVANQTRVLGLFLADTSAGINEEAIFEGYRSRPEPPDNVAERATSASFKLRETDKAFLYGQLSGLNLKPPAETLQSLLFSRDGPDAATLSTFMVPTEFIVGEDDVVVPPFIEILCAGYMRSAPVHVIPDTGHSVYFERPEVFNEILLRFIGRTRSEVV
ncbi:MAG: alpha/beta fold hydrolase [Hyphomicrobiaceae bacterium]